MKNLNQYLNKIERLHIEPSSYCNLKCPYCSRQTNAGYFKQENLSLKDIQNFIPDKKGLALKNVFLGGVFGDPLMNNEILEICRYIKNINPAISITIETNGSIPKSEGFYKDLSEVVNHINLSIDGLEDTNAIYRVGSDWHTIMRNINEMLSAKNPAKLRWNYIVFEHNEHQIDQTKELAKKLGFFNFMLKKSNRFSCYNPAVNIKQSSYEVADNNNKQGEIEFVTDDGTIQCNMVNENKIYIGSNGIIYPCCNTRTRKNFRERFFISVQNCTIETIFDQKEFDNLLDLHSPTCLKKCGSNRDFYNGCGARENIKL